MTALDRIWATPRRRRWRWASIASATGFSNTMTWSGTARPWRSPVLRQTGHTTRCGDATWMLLQADNSALLGQVSTAEQAADPLTQPEE